MEDQVFINVPLLSFDEEFYLLENPDVAEAIATGAFDGTAEDHYIEFGDREGRDPNQFFDVNFYFANNVDAAILVATDIFNTSLAHYELIGVVEERANVPGDLLFFDADFYLANNPDVLFAIATGQFGDFFRPEASAFAHFVFDGFEEGRLPNAQGSSRLPDLLAEGVEVRIAGATFAVDNELLESFLSARQDALMDANLRLGGGETGDVQLIVDFFFGDNAILLPDDLFVPIAGTTSFSDGLFF
ncbi:MAG: hypothetical protein AAF495_13270 [Pseudomonadota bacterium]